MEGNQSKKYKNKRIPNDEDDDFSVDNKKVIEMMNLDKTTVIGEVDELPDYEAARKSKIAVCKFFKITVKIDTSKPNERSCCFFGIFCKVPPYLPDCLQNAITFFLFGLC